MSRANPSDTGTPVVRRYWSPVPKEEACPKCGLPLRGRHKGSAGCRAGQLYHQLLDRALVPVRDQKQFITTVPSAVKALRALKLPAYTAMSYFNDYSGTTSIECWTTPTALERLKVVHVISCAIRKSLPEAARRCAKAPDVLAQVDAALRLGGYGDDNLDDIHELTKPLRFRRRPR